MSPSWFSYQLRSISCSTFFCLRATYSLVMSPISLSTSSSYIYYSSPYIMSCAISFIIDIFYFQVINLFIVSWKFLFPIFWLAPCIILAIPSITFFIDQLTVICCNLNIKNLNYQNATFCNWASNLSYFPIICCCFNNCCPIAF